MDEIHSLMVYEDLKASWRSEAAAADKTRGENRAAMRGMAQRGGQA